MLVQYNFSGFFSFIITVIKEELMISVNMVGSNLTEAYFTPCSFILYSFQSNQQGRYLEFDTPMFNMVMGGDKSNKVFFYLQVKQ